MLEFCVDSTLAKNSFEIKRMKSHARSDGQPAERHMKRTRAVAAPPAVAARTARDGTGTVILLFV